jgi:hypothetical protein
MAALFSKSCHALAQHNEPETGEFYLSTAPTPSTGGF